MRAVSPLIPMVVERDGGGTRTNRSCQRRVAERVMQRVRESQINSEVKSVVPIVIIQLLYKEEEILPAVSIIQVRD